MKKLYSFLFLIFPLIIAAQNQFAFDKIKGICFIGPNQPVLQQEQFTNIKTVQANWIALVPEATLERATLQLRPDSDNESWGETIEAAIQSIKFAQKAGFLIMLKPHIVLPPLATDFYIFDAAATYHPDKTGHATWRGELNPTNEEDWQTWETSYRTYILQLARIAALYEVEMLCIGTELVNPARKRPHFWRQLIQEVRQIYSGAITYAANWDEYNKVTFWDALDFIGVDTYFPINKSKIPAVDKTIQNWQKHLQKMERISAQYNRPILITEFGYRNVTYAGREPWLHGSESDILNNDAQTNLYEAFFQAVWTQKWIAGGFLWQWSALSPSENDRSFSPQGKPALEVAKNWYRKE